MPEAVFISYASEDLVAAERIGAALREAGVEVWFDKSELQGGDAWDQNIRKRIQDCALFVPVISATTERRHEGYFRLEWRLADRRTHHMGRSRAYLFPVCIDEVDEDNADVPESFWEVQWIKAPGGAVPAGFAERIKAALAPVDEIRKPEDGGRRGKRRSGTHHPSGTEWRWIAGIAALVVLLAGTIAYWPRISPMFGIESTPAGPAALEKSIAVLPFQDESDNAAGTGFADGVQEEILTKLANVRELTVKSRTTVAQYRDRQKSIPQIAEELGVNYIFDGTVRRSGSEVRLTGRLYEGKTEKLLRPPSGAFDYTVDITDLLKVQGDIAASIAAALQTVLSQQEKELLGKKATDNLSANDAYNAVLRAFSSDRPSRAWLKTQEDSLRAVVRMDERFSAAWGQLAVVDSLYVSLGYDATETRLADAKDAIEHATNIAPDSPEVIRSLGIYYFAARRDYARAIEQFERLGSLQPNSADVSGYLGDVQRHQGKWPEALANLRKATTLDSGNVVHTRTLENILVDGRLYQSAIMNRLRLLQVLGADPEANFRLALLELYESGQTTRGDKYVADLGAAKDTPAGLEYRMRWARAKGDLDEAIRLDQSGGRAGGTATDGSPEWVDAIEAAAVLGAKGDRAAARTRLDGVEQALRVRALEDENNGSLQSSLGLTRALLGSKDDALEAGLKAVELAKLADGSVDRIADATARLKLVLIRAWTGDKAKAIAELAELLKAPGLEVTVQSMKLDPWFAPLRGEADFDALLAKPENALPLFPDPGARGGPGGPGGRGNFPGGPQGGRGGPGGPGGGGPGGRGFRGQ